jgi:hypothetical protein
LDRLRSKSPSADEEVTANRVELAVHRAPTSGRSPPWTRGRRSRVSTLAQAGRSRVGPEPDLSIPALTTGRASREERRDEEDEQSNKAWPTCYGYREVAHWILLFVGPALSGTP